MASENKTTPTKASVTAFINAVDHDGRQRDAKSLLAMMKRITGLKPVMWGPSIIGFGQYHYQYESGREGDMPLIGFSPRKAKMVLYLMDGISAHATALKTLGPHKTSKACLYLGDFQKLDVEVLEGILLSSFQAMNDKHQTA